MTDQTNFGIAPISAGTSEFNMHHFLIKSLIGTICTMMPVEVMTVQAGGATGESTCSVMPLVNQIDGIGNATPHGIISNVPVWRLQGGVSAVVCDPAIGDIGLAVFAMRDMSSVQTNKAQSNPGSFRQYDWADAVYIGGIFNPAPTQYVLMDSTGVTVVAPNQITLQSPTINLKGAVVGTSTAAFSGNVTGAGTSLHTHVHSGVQAGGSNTGAPV
jgi:phage baseplate assembly protein gpV